MLDAITSQLSPHSRDLADRSIAATAGALFGVVLCGTAAIATGRAPFSLDMPMISLYASAIPLAVAGFMVAFSRKAPRLPMLATLWFLALFVPLMFCSEALLSWGELHFAGMVLPAKNFVGFRAIVVAAFSGLLFSGIEANGFVGKATQKVVSVVDWHKRHDEALRRLAIVDIDLASQRREDQRALDTFDRMLAAPRVEQECVLVEVEDAEEKETVFETSAAAA